MSAEFLIHLHYILGCKCKLKKRLMIKMTCLHKVANATRYVDVGLANAKPSFVQTISKQATANWVILLLVCLFLASCQKQSFDYYNKIEGDYTFTLQIHSIGLVIFDTTFITVGKIEKNGVENYINITSSSFALTATIFEDGTLEGTYNNSGVGEFYSPTEMEYSWGMHSPGGGSTSRITGKLNN